MTITAKFNGTCTRCNARITAGQRINWEPSVKATFHLTPADCEAAKATKTVVAPKPAVSVGSFSGVIALFNAAKAHLKYPKITLVCEGKKIILSVAGSGSKTPGSVNVAGEGQYPNRVWYGRVSPEGAWVPSNSGAAIQTALTSLLKEFGENPAGVAKAHGKLTGNCCFCNKVLGKGEDKRSIGVGFGPVCAEHYGLKAEWNKGAAELEATLATPAPAFIDYTDPRVVVLDEMDKALEAEFGPSHDHSNVQAVMGYLAE